MASSKSFTLLFVELPPKTFVGLNIVSFNSSPNFHGISEIPSGLHFIYTSPDASLAIRHGRWLNLTFDADTSIQTLKWSPDDESLVLLPPAISTPPASRGLVDYPALCDATSNTHHYTSTSAAQPDDEIDISPRDFPDLSSYITPALLNRIVHSDWKLSSISSSSRDSEASSVPGLTHYEVSSAFPPHSHLALLDIDLKRTWAEGDVGATRTERARDRSWYLGKLMDAASTISNVVDGNAMTESKKERQEGVKNLMGELQFCFLMVLTLANYSCLEQWKRILTVIFTCKTALSEIEGYFTEVLKVLVLQLRHADDVEGGLFELRDEVGCAWLRGLLDKFGESVNEFAGEEGALRGEMEGFEKEMRERFGWERKGEVLRRGMLELEDGERVEVSLIGVDEGEETGDWAPVVVET